MPAEAGNEKLHLMRDAVVLRVVDEEGLELSCVFAGGLLCRTMKTEERRRASLSMSVSVMKRRRCGHVKKIKRAYEKAKRCSA
jgi:hypothetical protein